MLRKQLLRDLRTSLLPRLDDGGLELVLLQLPLSGGETPGNPNCRPSVLLEETGAGATYLRHTHWTESNLISRRFLYMGCVLDGEVELFVGTSDHVAQNRPDLAQNPVEAVYRLRAGTCFLVPPRVPFIDGSCPHWEHTVEAPPDARIFWMEIAPTGVLLHLCRTQAGEHFAHSEIFVGDARLVTLSECLLDELQASEYQSGAIARSLLAAMLLRLDQSLVMRRCFQPDWRGHALAAPAESQIQRAGTAAVRRACEYIQANQNQNLTLERIAEHANVSPTHLNRLFRGTLGLSAMKFATESRLKTAQVLLGSTEMPVAEVGRTVGFAHPEHFSRVFSQHMAISPLEYRRQQQRPGR